MFVTHRLKSPVILGYSAAASDYLLVPIKSSPVSCTLFKTAIALPTTYRCSWWQNNRAVFHRKALRRVPSSSTAFAFAMQIRDRVPFHSSSHLHCSHPRPLQCKKKGCQARCFHQPSYRELIKANYLDRSMMKRAALCTSNRPCNTCAFLLPRLVRVENQRRQGSMVR